MENNNRQYDYDENPTYAENYNTNTEDSHHNENTYERAENRSSYEETYRTQEGPYVDHPRETRNTNYYDTKSDPTNYQNPYRQEQVVSPEAKRENQNETPAVSITSLVLGVVALLVCCFTPGLSIILSIAGLITGIIGLIKSNKGNYAGKGLAIGGIICSAIGIILGIIVFIVRIAFSFSLFDGAYRNSHFGFFDDFY